MMNVKQLAKKLFQERDLSDEELLYILQYHENDVVREEFAKLARIRQKEHFKNHIYIRGLIEVSNYCKNDCYYCGIRRSNQQANRYRLSKEDILSCCKQGYESGFRTFVMQGGEDGTFTDDFLVDVIQEIRTIYPDCAITLSLGERSKESYQRLYDAGANRYLLRHESIDTIHYGQLHPNDMSIVHRKQCLYNLKEIGFQTGCGIMVGSPHQTYEHIVKDIRFMQELKPEMIGIGPFLPHKDTPFKDEAKGSMTLTLLMLSICRLIFCESLIPSTTALSTIHPQGREMGILAGGNVVMPNLSPVTHRKKYLLYDDKKCSDEEAAEGRKALEKRMKAIGYEVVSSRGDFKGKSEDIKYV